MQSLDLDSTGVFLALTAAVSHGNVSGSVVSPHLLDALEELPHVHIHLRLPRRRLFNLHGTTVLRVAAIVTLSSLVALRIVVGKVGCPSRIVKVHDLVLVAIVVAVVVRVFCLGHRMPMVVLLLLGRADCSRLELLERVGGQVVEVGVGEIEVVIVHDGRRPCQMSACVHCNMPEPNSQRPSPNCAQGAVASSRRESRRVLVAARVRFTCTYTVVLGAGQGCALAS